ncbi:MAG TPA: 50S ribosomal protein L11 [Candidatus Nanoarchaeia archaeon]|nr:50S ribosomal protein L11 [Candidatus Nanoarchaeia archaeon]
MINVKLLVEGGEMKPGPTLGQKLGPTGVSVNLVLQKVNEATKNFKGIKVPIELQIDPATKTFEVKVFSPPTSELLKKELGLEKGSGAQKKSYAGNASIEQIISVAKTKMPNLLCKDLKSAVKTVIGTCVTLGILVENQLAKEVEPLVDEGKYDEEIKSEKTETPDDKKKALKDYFDKVKSEQDKLAKQEAAAKEAAAAAATPATGAPVVGAATATAATPTAKGAAPAEAKKETAKPVTKSGAKPAAKKK